jgi:hypothetical protein
VMVVRVSVEMLGVMLLGTVVEELRHGCGLWWCCMGRLLGEEGLCCNPRSSTTTKAKQRGIARNIAVVEDAGWMQR